MAWAVEAGPNPAGLVDRFGDVGRGLVRGGARSRVEGQLRRDPDARLRFGAGVLMLLAGERAEGLAAMRAEGLALLRAVQADTSASERLRAAAERLVEATSVDHAGAARSLACGRTRSRRSKRGIKMHPALLV